MKPHLTKLQHTLSITRSRKIRLSAFKALLREDSAKAAFYLVKKIARQKYARSEDFQFLKELRGDGAAIEHPFYYCYAVSESPSLRHHLSSSEQKLFWKGELAKSGLWTKEDRQPGEPRLIGFGMEKGSTLEELKIPLRLLLSEPVTPLSRLGLAHLLLVFRHNEVGNLLKGTEFDPEVTSSKSLIYSKRFISASSVVKDQAHLELSSKFSCRPFYRICVDAESQVIAPQNLTNLILLDKYILYSRFHQFGVCLKAFANSEGQIFVPGVMYGTDVDNDIKISKEGKRNGFFWQPLRSWNPNNEGSMPVEELAKRFPAV
jgi:hypothetical protein